MAGTRIYLVEDDESIRELILYALTSSGFEAQGFDLSLIHICKSGGGWVGNRTAELFHSAAG